MTRPLILALLAALMVSCRTKSPQTDNNSPAGRGGGFIFSETSQFNTNRILGPQDTEVDYKGTINVEPAPAELANDALPELTPEEKLEMQSVAQLATSLKGVMHNWTRVGKEIQQATSGGRTPTAAEVATLQRHLLAESAARSNILHFVEVYARRVATARTGATNEEDPAFLQAFASLTDPLLHDANGKPVILNVDRLRELFRNELNRYIRDAEEIRKSSVRVRIRAALTTGDKQRLPIHVANYDNIDNPLRLQEDRVSYGSASDRERVAEEFKTASAIADFANDAMQKKGQFQSAVRSTIDAVKRDLANLDSAGRTFFGNITNRTELSRAIADLKTIASTNQLRHIAALEQFMTVFETVSQEVQTLQQLANNSSSTDVMDSVFKTADAAKTLQSTLPQLQINDALAAVPDLAELAAKKALNVTNQPGDVSTQQWVQSLLPNTRQSLEKIRDSLSRLQPLLAALSGLSEGTAVASAGDDVIDPREKPQPLDAAVPGYISLVNLANRGDKVEVRTELVNEDNSVDREYPLRVFDVEKFGLSDTLSANVIFANRLDSPAGGADFVAAPSVSWTLHYRQPLKPDSSALSKVYYYLDPGAGINVAALNFDNSGVQVGVGGQISIFRDIFQVGGGYNLNANDNNTYIFVGIGIFEALKQGSSLFGGN